MPNLEIYFCLFYLVFRLRSLKGQMETDGNRLLKLNDSKKHCVLDAI